MILGSKTHTTGDVRRWTVSYDFWLDNAAEIDQINVQSSSLTCTVSQEQVLGRDIVFFLSGGVTGETFTISLTMTDTFGNIKNDTIMFTCIAP